MKRKITLLLIFGLIIMNSLWVAYAEDAAVDLTISTAGELKSFRDRVNNGESFSGKYVLLADNIDLQNELWIPIGLDGDGAGFAGVFDGGNKTISNLFVDSRSDGYDNAAGLFGSLRGTVKNLTVCNARVYNLVEQDPTVDGTAVIAGCTGYGATIDNVNVKNASVTSNRYVGGISGYAAGVFTNCTVEDVSLSAVPNKTSGGSFDNGDKLGGIVGYINSGDATIIENCELAGDNKLIAYRDCGGIAGYVQGTSQILNNTVDGDLEMVVDLSVLEPRDNHNFGVITGRGTAASTTGNSTENVVVTTVIKEDIGAEYDVGVGKAYTTLAEAIATVKVNGESAVVYKLYGENEIETGYSHGVVDFGAEAVTVIGADHNSKLTVTGGGVPDIKGVVFKDVTFADEGDYLPTANEFMYQNFIDCTFVNVMFECGIRVSGDTSIEGSVITTVKSQMYALWLDSGEFTVSDTSIIADGGYGLVKSDASGSIFDIQNSILEYKGISVGKKEALNTNGLIITANGNTFKNCEEGILPADKYNTVNGEENVNDDVLIAQTNNIVLYAAETEGIYYYSVAEAIYAARPVGVVTVVNDASLSETVKLTEGDNITLDLAGYTVTGCDNAEAGSFNLINNIKGTLTIRDSSESGTGKLTLQAVNNRGWSGKSAIVDNRGGVLNIEGGILTHLGGTDMAYVVDTNANWYGDAETNITEGTLFSEYIAVRLYMSSAEATNNSSGKAIVNVSGGNVNGSVYAIWAQAPENNTGQTGEINITGGVVGNIFTACTPKAVVNTEVSGGTTGDIIAEKGELTISGGTINGELKIYEDDGKTVAAEDNIITSGSFLIKPSEGYVADKSILLNAQRGGYYIVEVEATLEFVVSPSGEVSKGSNVTVSAVVSGLGAYDATELELSISLPGQAISDVTSPFAVNCIAGRGIRNKENVVYYDEEDCKIKISAVTKSSQNVFSDICETVLFTFTVDENTVLDKMLFGAEADKAECFLKTSDGIYVNIAPVAVEVGIIENALVAAKTEKKKYINDYVSDIADNSVYSDEGLKDIEIYKLIARLRIDAAVTVEEINAAVDDAIAKINAVPTIADTRNIYLKKISTTGKTGYTIDDILATGVTDADRSRSEFYKTSIEEYKATNGIPEENAEPVIINDVQMQEIITLTNNIIDGTAEGYETMKGDFNCTGKVDISDAAGAMAYICGVTLNWVPTAQSIVNADLHSTGDGVITVFDVIEIMELLMSRTISR